MSMRATSLQATNVLAINREIDSKYDAVLAVRDKLVEIEKVADLDIEQLLTDLQNAQDFTGINVVAGSTAGWNAATKTITVPTLKGDQGIQGPVGATGATGATGEKGDRGLTGAAGTNGRDGINGSNGVDGLNGRDGIDGKDLTIEQISYNNGTGRFIWQFSDGTSYETPDLRGAKGDTGSKGDKGETGLGVHHIKGTSTTNVLGDFATYGNIDTYTVYGDAAETINLGYFRVNNGLAKDGQTNIMFGSTYDTNSNGVVDNSERLGGQLPNYYVDVVSAQSVSGNKTFTNNVTVQGDLVVNGNSVTVNAQTVEVEDNLLLINKGEVGNGVTAGEAGILVDRGTAADYKFVWEEAGQAFKIGEVGSLQKVATREDTPISSGIAVWDTGTNKFNTTLSPKVNSVQLNGGSGAEGTLSWNTTEGTADLELPGGSTLQVGQESVRLVRNSTASMITNGTVCMFAGTIGNSGRIKVKPFTGGFNEAMYVYGVATQDIVAGADGLITIEGKVRGIDTTGASVGETWADEDILYVKPGDNGRLTKVVPAVTELRMPIASVIKAHTNGTLEIRFTPINENQFEPRNANIQTHIASTSNPHGVTKSQVGLGNVDNTSDISKPISTATQAALDLKAPIANPTFTGTVSGITKAMVGLGNVDNTADSSKSVLSATKWTTGRVLSLGGDATGSVSIDGSSDVTLTVNVVDDSHNHAFGNLTGKPTTVAGYGITDVYTKTQTDSNISTAVAGLVNGSPAALDTLNELAVALGNDANFATTVSTSIGTKVTKNADIVGGTNTKITYDAKGLVTGGTSLAATDIPALDWSKITTGKPTTLSGYGISDATPSSHIGTTGASHGVATTSVNGFMSSTDKTKLDGIATNANNYVHPTSGVVAGTYTKITVDSNGHATAGSTPTTLAGYSIGDAYTKTESDTALALKTNKSDTDSVNMLRADKFLAAQNIANMIYTNGDLTKIQYNNATDVNYEVLNYVSGNLSTINHYTGGVLRGTTTLSYSSGNLVSAVFA